MILVSVYITNRNEDVEREDVYMQRNLCNGNKIEFILILYLLVIFVGTRFYKHVCNS